MLDVEPESDQDEDTIIEWRRKLHQAIVNKYHQPGPTTPQASSPTAPLSEVDSETAIRERIEEVLEEEKKEEEGRQEGVGVEGQEGSTSGLVKKDTGEEVKVQEELGRVLSALRDAIRNGDMFSEENLFTEMVSEMGEGGGVEDINRVWKVEDVRNLGYTQGY